MAFKHHIRVVARGFWGKPSVPGFCHNMTARRIRRLMEQGKAVGLRQITNDKKDDKAPFILGYSPTFPAGPNARETWSTSGEGQLNSIPRAFAGGPGDEGAAVAWLNGTPQTETDFRVSFTAGAYQIPQNTAFSVRFFLERLEKEQVISLWQLRWGDSLADGRKWQFQMRSGEWEVMRLAPAWTEAGDKTLQALLAKKDRTSDEEAQVESLKTAIYLDFARVDLDIDRDECFGRVHTLTFLPEPAGKLHIFREGAKVATVEQSAIKKTRAVGVLWGSSALNLVSAGGAFYWQVGWPLFNATGRALDGPLQNGIFTDFLDDVLYAAGCQTALNATLPGTSIAFAKENINDAQFRFLLTLTASPGRRRTPFLYWAQATILPDARDGDDEVVYDSDNYLLPGGACPFTNDSMSWDGRKRSLNLTLLDIGGAMFPGAIAGGQHALENRVVDVYINGSPFITRGVIVRAEILDAAGADDGETRAQNSRATTEIALSIVTGLAACADFQLDFDPIGDGRNVNQFARIVLRGAGFFIWQLEGIDANGGTVIEGAAPGEDAAERPTPGVKILDYAKSLPQNYGLGADLFDDNLGRLRFERPPSATARHNDQDITFSGQGTRHTSLTYPGRLVILRPLSLPRDFSDVSNEFTVIGDDDAADEDGNPPAFTLPITDSIEPGTRRSLGRKKSFGIVNLKSARSRFACYIAARSRAFLFCLTGYWLGFETYFHEFLEPGMLVNAEGALYRIERILGASACADRMQLALRRMS